MKQLQRGGKENEKGQNNKPHNPGRQGRNIREEKTFKNNFQGRLRQRRSIIRHQRGNIKIREREQGNNRKVGQQNQVKEVQEVEMDRNIIIIDRDEFSRWRKKSDDKSRKRGSRKSKKGFVQGNRKQNQVKEVKRE